MTYYVYNDNRFGLDPYREVGENMLRRKVIISYTIVLFLPILICSLYYAHSFNSLKAEETYNHQLMLENISTHTDTLFHESSQMFSYLSLNNYVTALSYDKNTFDSTKVLDRMHLQKTLHAFKISNSLYDNIGIYFKADDYYVGSSTCYQGALYSSDTRSFLNGSDFEGILTRLSNAPSTLYTTEDKDFITIARVLLYDSNNDPLSVCCLQIKKNALKAFLDVPTLNAQNCSLYLALSEDIFLSFDNTDTDVESILKEDAPKSGYSHREEGSLIMDISPLNFNDLYLIMASPKIDYYRSLQNLLIHMLASILLCVTTGSVAIWYYSNKSYNPVSKILRFIGALPQDENEKIHDEYALIIKYLSDSKNEIISHRKQLRESYLQKLLSGTISCDQIPEADRPFDFSEASVCVVSLLPKKEFSFNTLDNSSALLVFSIENILKDLLGQRFKDHYCLLHNDTIVILIRTDSAEGDNLPSVEKIIDTLKSKVYEFFGFEIIAGISNILPMDRASSGYMQSKVVIDYQNLFEKQSILSYDDLPNTGTIASLSLNNDEYFINMVVGGDESQINDYFDTLEKEIKNTPLTITDAQSCYAFFYRLLANLNVYCQTHFSLKMQMLNEIDSVPVPKSMMQMLSQVRDISLSVCSELKNHSLPSLSESVTEEVCRFIDKNYADCNMNLNYIADSLNISPSYLSRKFKEMYRISIIDYLYEVRIEKSIELLATTDLKVSAIAKMCGFQDSNAFIRIFKKQKGITPGKYKTEALSASALVNQ